MKRTLLNTLLTAMIALAPCAALAQTPDLSSLGENGVAAYTLGNHKMTVDNILPISTSSSGYVQKWEFYIYSSPYKLRLKFEISNFAFSSNEGKVSGYIESMDSANPVKYDISQKFSSSEWHSENGRLDLRFGDYILSFDGKQFHIRGSFEKGTFAYDVPAKFWQPGTGTVYFGNSGNDVFKYGILTYQQPVTGIYTIDGKQIESSGQAYGNHYATTIAIYNMFDELSDFREIADDVLVEFRYFVPAQKYEAEPFGYMFAAAGGVPVLEASSISRESLEKWVDDENYGYEIDARQRIAGTDGSNRGIFTVLTASPKPSDPYANLPAFQKNIASRFAKPIEYSIIMNWELLLDVDGIRAKIPMNGSYTITRMR